MVGTKRSSLNMTSCRINTSCMDLHVWRLHHSHCVLSVVKNYWTVLWAGLIYRTMSTMRGTWALLIVLWGYAGETKVGNHCFNEQVNHHDKSGIIRTFLPFCPCHWTREQALKQLAEVIESLVLINNPITTLSTHTWCTMVILQYKAVKTVRLRVFGMFAICGTLHTDW